MDFFEYASERTPVVAGYEGIYLACPPQAAGDALVMSGNGAEARYSLVRADVESIWLAYRSRFEDAVRRKIAESDFIPEARGYAAALSEIIFGVGPRFMRNEHIEPVSEDAYLDFLGEKLGRRGASQNAAAAPAAPAPAAVDFPAFMAKKIAEITPGRYIMLYKGKSMIELDGGESFAVIRGTRHEFVDMVLDRKALGSIFEEYENMAASREAWLRAADALAGSRPGVLRAVYGALKEKGGIDFGSWGVIHKEGRLTAYIRIPEFALADYIHGDRHIRIPESRVGVDVYGTGNMSTPYMLDPMLHHPFVHDSGRGREICMQDVYRQSRGLAENIAEGLSAAKKALQTSLTARRGAALVRVKDFYELHKIEPLVITADEIRKRGLKVTNDEH